MATRIRDQRMSGWVTPTLIVATLGWLLGAFVLYALGRWGSRGLTLRYPDLSCA